MEQRIKNATAGFYANLSAANVVSLLQKAH